MPIRGKKMADIKQANRRAILRILHENGAISRKKLARRLSLTPAAITLIVADMIEEGILYEGATIVQSGTAGRREINLGIDTRRYIALGAAININETILSAVMLSGEQIVQERLDPIVGEDAETVVRHVAERLKEFTGRYVLDGQRIVGLGVSLRGIVDGQRGVSVESFGLWEQKNVDIRALFEQYTPWRATVDNNVRSIAYAQMFLSCAPSDGNMLFVRSEHGIGAALMVDYRLLEGNHHRSAELGHISVVPNGLPCACGGRGCLETVASYQAIMSAAQSALDKRLTPALYALCKGDREKITFGMIDEAVTKGDAPVKEIWERAVSLTAEALKMAIRLLDAQKIVLYGKMFEDTRYLDELRARLKSDRAFGVTDAMIEKSAMNQRLDPVAAPILAVRDFFDRGGLDIG